MSTLSIRYINRDRLRQTNCNEFLNNFVMKKAGQNLFNCSLCYVQPYLIDDCSFFFLYTYFNDDRISKFKPVQSSRWALVSSALPNLNMKHYKSVKILSNFQNVKTLAQI